MQGYFIISMPWENHWCLRIFAARSFPFPSFILNTLNVNYHFQVTWLTFQQGICHILLKGLWHASAHVRQLDFFPGDSFSRLAFWWRNPLPSTLRGPKKPQYQYSRAIWSIWEVLNAIFCIFVQVLSRKFKVIEDNRTKPCSLLSVFIQTDQMWPLMWSSGFHFCLLMFSSQRSTFDGYFLNDKFVKRVKKGFLDTAVDC